MLTPLLATLALAAPVTDPADARSWQGATLETFRAALGYASLEELVAANVLDDGTFATYADLTPFDARPSAPCGPETTGITMGAYLGNMVATGIGYSYDPAVAENYVYTSNSNPADWIAYGSCLDWYWVQDVSNNTPDTDILSANTWDLGGPSNQVAVFPVVDHGPLPEETMEYTVYLSNDAAATTIGSDGATQWVRAELERVYLEGWHTGWTADGFTTVWRLPGRVAFRYVAVIASGPNALIQDGDDEIDGVMGLTYKGSPVCGSSDDIDGDGVCDIEDNCVRVENPFQDDADGDGTGDACDPCPADPLDDRDGDGLCADVDPCPDDSSNDSDGDGACDGDDLCDGDDASGDADGDGVCDDVDACAGDDATGDTDADGVCDDADACSGDDATGDTDADGVCDSSDLCDGDDALGDADGDGACGEPAPDEEAPVKEPAACGCAGVPDASGTAGGVGALLVGLAVVRRRRPRG
jgi:MYXO-CTERM domain-containing protein